MPTGVEIMCVQIMLVIDGKSKKRNEVTFALNKDTVKKSEQSQ